MKTLKQRYESYYLNIFFALSLAHFFFNFLASPVVKYSFLAISLYALIGTITLSWQNIIYSMCFLSFFEGQGRIVWGYHPVFRVLFDILILIAITRGFVKSKKIMDNSKLPQFIHVLIILHFSWWLMELFNPLAANPLAGFATSKYFVFPILFFLTLVQNPINIHSKQFRKFTIFLSIIILLEAILSIMQFYQGIEMMKAISSNYTDLFKKYKLFTGFIFRPWGTTYTSGGAGVWLFLTLPFLYFSFVFKSRIKDILYKFLLLIIIISSWFTLFISQVRSVFLKHVILLFLCFLAHFVATKFKVRKFLSYIIVSSLLIFAAINYLPKYFNVGENLELASSITRIQQLEDEGISAQRAGPSEILSNLAERMPLPFGFGPGMTSSFLPQYQARRDQIKDTPDWYFWNMDNFYAMSFLELGVGAIFYISIFLTVVLLILHRSIDLYKKGLKKEFQNSLVCFFACLIILIGNWGANAVAFNPESFFFWLLASIGITQPQKDDKKLAIVEEIREE